MLSRVCVLDHALQLRAAGQPTELLERVIADGLYRRNTISGVQTGNGLRGEGGAAQEVLRPSRWRVYHFADALSPLLLIHMLKVEGGAAE